MFDHVSDKITRPRKRLWTLNRYVSIIPVYVSGAGNLSFRHCFLHKILQTYCFQFLLNRKKILMQLILERTNCNMLGWILGSFQIYLSHFNHSPLRYSWVDNLIFRLNWNLEMLIFDEREKRRRKTKNNNFNLKPQLASMARLKFIDHWREASVSYHCAIRKLLRSRSFLGSLVVSES